MMSWQTAIFLKLRDREWHQLGALFEQVETQIPLHLAMRRAMNPARGRSELPTATEARWVMFRDMVSMTGVETSGDQSRFKWTDKVRLRYVADRVCEDCRGPVIKAGWTSGRGKYGMRVICLACEAGADQPVLQPLVTPTQQPPPVVEPAPAPISLSHAQRNMAKAIRAEFRIGLSVNEIVRQLQRWTPREIINRYRHSLRTVQARGPPATIAAANNP
jgi:hypothetical protein